jgi:hypothetical protein
MKLTVVQQRFSIIHFIWQKIMPNLGCVKNISRMIHPAYAD